MNDFYKTWYTKAGKFTDGEHTYTITEAYDIVMLEIPIEAHTFRMGVTIARFLRFALLVCTVLSIPEYRVVHWKNWEKRMLF